MTLAEQFVNEVKEVPYDENIVDHLDGFKLFRDSRIIDESIVKRSRWYERFRYCLIFTDGSLAAYEENSGLTEIQEDTPYESTAYLIEPYTETVTKYRKVENV